ncbi:MAG: hypothetical protein M5U19_07135 [Microthrixaceae bacterium]|nr:hypothetical protein [Microthrixaceae bacterium]
MGPIVVVAGRLLSAVVLAAVAATGALVALSLRTGIGDAPRVVGVTLVMSLTYLGIGVTVGAFVRSEVNGSLIVVFIWMFDVFFGPAMGGSAPLLRLFPLHFPTVVVTDAASGHSGPLGDIGLSAVWAVASLSIGIGALVRTTRPHSAVKLPRLVGPQRSIVALQYGFRDYRRNSVLWVLLVGLPVAFITLSILVTPADPTPVELTEDGVRGLQLLAMDDLHGAIMVPITVGFIAGLAGLFVSLGSADADQRLVLSGFRTLEVLSARLGIVIGAALLTTAVALGVTAASFNANNWPLFGLANVVLALTYAMIGVLVGPHAGLLGGLYIMLALPSSTSESRRTRCSTPHRPPGPSTCLASEEFACSSTQPSRLASMNGRHCSPRPDGWWRSLSQLRRSSTDWPDPRRDGNRSPTRARSSGSPCATLRYNYTLSYFA